MQASIHEGVARIGELLGGMRIHPVRKRAMNAIKGTVKDGRLEIVVPTNWPDGTEVIVQPVSPERSFGVDEEDWSDSPEAISEWLQWYDSLEPLIFREEERAAWGIARREQKDLEKATFNERGQKLQRMWE